MSNRLKEFRQAKADIVADLNKVMESVDASKGLSDEQKATFDQKKANLERINESIVVAEALADHERSLEAGVDANEQAEQEARASAEDESQFSTFGEQMCAIANASINKEVDPRLQFAAAPVGANEGVAQDGGYLVQTDFSNDLWRRTYETGQLTRRVRRIPISARANGLKMNAVKESSRANGSRWGGVTAEWGGEATAGTSSKPKFRLIELDLKKLIGLAYATDDLLRDSTALGAILQMAFAEEFGFKLDDAIMRGTGSGQPRGYLNHAAAVTVDDTTDPSTNAHQAAGSVIVDNITAMWARMWARSRKNAVWLINQEVETQMMTMKIGATPVYIPPGGLRDAPLASLLSRPVVPVEQCSARGQKGDVQFVDLSQYLMIEKGGLQAAQSVHVRFLTDEMTFRFILRTDGEPAWDGPLTPYKGSDTLSPFVILGERDGTA